MRRSCTGEVFGWKFEDWSGMRGCRIFGAVTGEEGCTLGIDGTLIRKRQGKTPEIGQSMNGFSCTMGVADYDL